MNAVGMVNHFLRYLHKEKSDNRSTSISCLYILGDVICSTSTTEYNHIHNIKNILDNQTVNIHCSWHLSLIACSSDYHLEGCSFRMLTIPGPGAVLMEHSIQIPSWLCEVAFTFTAFAFLFLFRAKWWAMDWLKWHQDSNVLWVEWWDPRDIYQMASWRTKSWEQQAGGLCCDEGQGRVTFTVDTWGFCFFSLTFCMFI